MATIGLSRPYFAIYSNSGSVVTYSDGATIGKYTEMNLELEEGDANVLFADNAPAESDPTFSGGTVTISTDDLRPEAAIAILGMQQETLEATGITTEGAGWLVSNDNQNIPYVGLGGIIKKKVGGATRYVGFVYDKIQFRNPNRSAVTQGETIEWQVPELTAQIFRNDKPTHDWYRETTLLNTEEEAAIAVMQYLSITQTGG